MSGEMSLWGMDVLRGMGVCQGIMYSSGRWVFGGEYFDGYIGGDGCVAGYIAAREI